MKQLHALLRDERGATVVELAFALPVFIALIWMLVQLGFVFRANAGIQQALGEGARFATLCVNPNANLGCGQPTVAQVQARMQATVGGHEMGTFEAETPVPGVSGGAAYYDLRVNFSMPTSLLIYPGPTVTLSKTKRVWVAS
jgi:Flp pilus assembly protein TadG